MIKQLEEGKKDPTDNIIYYEQMELMCGVAAKDATFKDFHRLVKCLNLFPNECPDKSLVFPKTCSSPPCDVCLGKGLRIVQQKINVG